MTRGRALPLILLLAGATGAAAVPIQPGVTYGAGTELESPEYGASLVIPPGFQGVLPHGEELLVLTTTAAVGTILVGVDEMTVEEARQTMSQAVPLGDGVVLRPEQAPTVSGSSVTGHFAVLGTVNPLVATAKAIVGPSGIGIVFLAVSPADSAPALGKALGEIVGTLDLKAPAPPPAAASSSASGTSGGGGDDSWATYLKGMHLVRFFSGSSYNEETHLYLCSDQTFRWSRGGGGYGWNASGAFQASDRGRWKATGTGNSGTLILDYDDGSRSTHDLGYRDEKLFLDDKRHLRDKNDVCS